MRLSRAATLAVLAVSAAANAQDIPTQYYQEHPLTYPPQGMQAQPAEPYGQPQYAQPQYNQQQYNQQQYNQQQYNQQQYNQQPQYGQPPQPYGQQQDRRQPYAQPQYVQPNPNAPSAAQGALQGGDVTDSTGDFLPPVDDVIKHQNNVAYMTGGIGDEELAAFKERAHDFDLKVLTTAPNGEFVSGYTLRVLDKSGNSVFEAPGEGPYFYLNLPAGTYTVEEMAGSSTQQKKVTLGSRRGGPRELRFYWQGD